jgi:hypothetical protein
MIAEYNYNNPNDRLEQLDLPKLIARAVNYLEAYFPLLESNPVELAKLIKDNWINYKQKVVVNVNAEIVGLKTDGSIELKDNMGFSGSLRPFAKRFGFDAKHFIN